MGFSRQYAVDLLVSIDAVSYYRLPYREKYTVRDALSSLNWQCRDKKMHLLLITPGRICTSSPELGVPSSFADISEFNAIIEVSEQNAGYMPELSYGSHIFQDLVEAGILYSAVFKDESTLAFQPEKLKQFPNSLSRFLEHAEPLQEVIHVVDASDAGIRLYYDMPTEHLLLIREKEEIFFE